MVKNFEYVSIDKHDFISQNKIYTELNAETRLDDETKKFIAFLAGTGFFRKWNLSLKEWFNSETWFHPYWKDRKQKTIDEILNIEYGLNYLKIQFLEMPYWKR